MVSSSSHALFSALWETSLLKYWKKVIMREKCIYIIICIAKWIKYLQIQIHHIWYICLTTNSVSLKWNHVYLILSELAKSCLTSAVKFIRWGDSGVTVSFSWLFSRTRVPFSRYWVTLLSLFLWKPSTFVKVSYKLYSPARNGAFLCLESEEFFPHQGCELKVHSQLNLLQAAVLCNNSSCIRSSSLQFLEVPRNNVMH